MSSPSPRDASPTAASSSSATGAVAPVPDNADESIIDVDTSNATGQRRTFTDAERRAQVAATIEEEEQAAAEAAALRDEQKRMAATIAARRIHFSRAPAVEDESQSLQPAFSSSSSSSSSSSYDPPPSSAASHRIHVCFVERSCRTGENDSAVTVCVAPLCVGWAAKRQRHVIDASMAHCPDKNDVVADATVNPVVTESLRQVGITPPTSAPAISTVLQRCSSDPHLSRSLFVTVDEESKSALEACLTSIESSKCPRVLHHPLSAPTLNTMAAASSSSDHADEAESDLERIRRETREFVDELPDIISFMA